MKIKDLEVDPISLFSHELKTPLSSLRMGLGMIQSDPQEDHQHILRLMGEEVERMIELVCGHLDKRLLLEGTEKEGKKELLSFSWVSWEDVVSRALGASLLAAERKGISLGANGRRFLRERGEGPARKTPRPSQKSAAKNSTRFEEAVESGEGGSEGFAEVFGDSAWLAQALGNLLSNALKAAPENSSVFVDWGFSPEEGLRCSVEDEGSGFSPENKDKPSDFFKLGGRGGERGKNFGGMPDSRRLGAQLKGHGMGLPIARDIVAAHGGLLEARSSGKGKGAAFCFVLPLARWRAGRRRNLLNLKQAG